MAPGPDGRTFQCRYCGTQILVQVDAEQLAAGMKLDLSNTAAFLHRLAQMLESAFADRTKVQRHGAEIAVIEIDLAPDMFLVKREGHGVVAQHKKIVRGIALKTTAHPIDRWVEMLHGSLAAHANENTRATAALVGLFGKR
jgi:hypothetical protein